MVVDRDTASVIPDPDAAVGEQGHLDPVAVSGQCLVYGIVDYLVDQMVQAALAGRADVHAGALAYSLQSLKDRDRPCVIRQSGNSSWNGHPRAARAPAAVRPGAPIILPGSTVRLSRTCHAARGYRAPATARAAAARPCRALSPALPRHRRVRR